MDPNAQVSSFVPIRQFFGQLYGNSAIAYDPTPNLPDLPPNERVLFEALTLRLLCSLRVRNKILLSKKVLKLKK